MYFVFSIDLSDLPEHILGMQTLIILESYECVGDVFWFLKNLPIWV